MGRAAERQFVRAILMHSMLARFALGSALIMWSGACSGAAATNPSQDSGPPSVASATLDGAQWVASLTTAIKGPDRITVNALSNAGTSSQVLLSLTFARTGVGEQAFLPGLDATAPGVSVGFGTGAGSRSWTTRLPGGSGSVTISQVTDTRVVGTFTFVAPALGTATLPFEMRALNGSFSVRMLPTP